MSILEELWEKAGKNEQEMFELLLLLASVKPSAYTRALKELIHHYAAKKSKEVVE